MEYTVTRDGRVFNAKGKEMKQRSDKDGYKTIALYYNGEYHTVRVHRIVAEKYIPNPDNLPCINHKNEIRFDNRVENLEWCSYSYNNNYNGHQERVAKKKERRLLC